MLEGEANLFTHGQEPSEFVLLLESHQVQLLEWVHWNIEILISDALVMVLEIVLAIVLVLKVS